MLKHARYVIDKIELLRFKNKKDLRIKLNKIVRKYHWKIGTIEYKSYYDNNFQDWEVLVELYDYSNELIFDVTIYYCKTRTNEKIIVESAFEPQF